MSVSSILAESTNFSVGLRQNLRSGVNMRTK
jgi:hypothetical protein